MASDALAWEPALAQLAAAGLRAVALDRRGYGASGAPEPYAATTVQEQAEDVGALLRALDAAPALLVGEGFGALVVLELLVRRPELARAAVLADPPLHAFVPAATAALADERTLLEQGLREGGPAAAVRAWLGRRRRRRGARRARGRRAAGLLRRLRRPVELVAVARRAARDRRLPVVTVACTAPRVATPRSPGSWRRTAAATATCGACSRSGAGAGVERRRHVVARGAGDLALVGIRTPHAPRHDRDRPAAARASANASSAAIATGTSGSAAAVTSASRLRSGALRFSAW